MLSRTVEVFGPTLIVAVACGGWMAVRESPSAFGLTTDSAAPTGSRSFFAPQDEAARQQDRPNDAGDPGQNRSEPGQPVSEDVDWKVKAVGGEPIAAVIGFQVDGAAAGKEEPFTAYRCGPCLIDTPLPEGYPRPTAPGAIELKRYPSVRRAEITMTSTDGQGVGMRTAQGASSRMFWPLFQHIQQRGIAMTSPVETDYTGFDPARGDTEVDRVTMSFLYRSTDLGPTGGAERGVIVRDSEPLTVVSIGLRGSYSAEAFADAIKTLQAWIEQADGWEQSGDPRSFGYNGPSTRSANRWSEVQIPVKRAAATTAGAEEGSGGTEADPQAGAEDGESGDAVGAAQRERTGA